MDKLTRVLIKINCCSLIRVKHIFRSKSAKYTVIQLLVYPSLSMFTFVASYEYNLVSIFLFEIFQNIKELIHNN